MKLADFGLARQLSGADALWERDLGGTPGFMAPEISRSLKKGSKIEPHGLNSDVWSMGIVMKETAELLGRSADVSALVDFACVDDRNKRPSAVQLSERLESLSDEAREAVKAARSGVVGNDVSVVSPNNSGSCR